MRNRVTCSVVLLISALAFSRFTFGQTYGTKGEAPGAWKPDDLPKGLGNAKPFDPHDLSGVWSMPTKGYEAHALTSKPDPTVLDLGKQSALPPPMTAWGKAKFDANKPGYGPRAVPNGTGNNPISICDPLGYPYVLWA